MAIDIDKIYKSTWDHYLQAQSAMTEKRAFLNILIRLFQMRFQALRQINLNLDHLMRKIMQFCLLI